MSLPAVKAREVLSALQRAGFYVDHVTGSHYILRHPERSGRVTVPYHGARDIKRAVLKTILEQASLTEQEFLELL